MHIHSRSFVFLNSVTSDLPIMTKNESKIQHASHSKSFRISAWRKYMYVGCALSPQGIPSRRIAAMSGLHLAVWLAEPKPPMLDKTTRLITLVANSQRHKTLKYEEMWKCEMRKRCPSHSAGFQALDTLARRTRKSEKQMAGLTSWLMPWLKCSLVKDGDTRRHDGRRQLRELVLMFVMIGCS